MRESFANARQIAVSAITAFVTAMFPLIAGAQTASPVIDGYTLDSRAFNETFGRPFWKALADVPCQQAGLVPSVTTPLSAQTLPPLKHRLQQIGGPLLPAYASLTEQRELLRTTRYYIQRIQFDGRIK